MILQYGILRRDFMKKKRKEGESRNSRKGERSGSIAEEWGTRGKKWKELDGSRSESMEASKKRSQGRKKEGRREEGIKEEKKQRKKHERNQGGEEGKKGRRKEEKRNSGLWEECVQ